MQPSTIPPKNDDYIVGYAGTIPTIKEACGHTFGDTQRLLTNKNRRPIWPARDINDTKWPIRSRELMNRSRQDILQEAEENNQKVTSRISTLQANKHNIFGSGLGQRSKTEMSNHPVLHRRSNSKYISGYAAHIPKYVQQVGASFSETSHSARWEFQQANNRPETAAKVVDPNIVRSSTSLSTSHRPVSKNVIANYGGHIPAYKFRFGGSFAKLTDSKLY